MRYRVMKDRNEWIGSFWYVWDSENEEASCPLFKMWADAQKWADECNREQEAA